MAVLEVGQQAVEGLRVAEAEDDRVLERRTAPGAGGEDEVVVGQRGPVGARHLAALGVDAGDRRGMHRRALLADDVGEGAGVGVRRRERLADGQRRQREPVVRRDDGHVGRVAGEGPQRQQRLERPDAAAGDQDAPGRAHGSEGSSSIPCSSA